MRPEVFAVALLAALVVVAGSGCRDRDQDRRPNLARGDDAAPISPSSTPVPPRTDGCPVTQPNHQIPPGQADNPGASEAPYHGNGRLWTALYPEGIIQRPRRDGSIREKFPWWRAGRGRLVITGHRLDGRARPLRARVPAGYGPTGFQATALIFPSGGCWSVTGAAGGASLTFVTLVVAARGS